MNGLEKLKKQMEESEYSRITVEWDDDIGRKHFTSPNNKIFKICLENGTTLFCDTFSTIPYTGDVSLANYTCLGLSKNYFFICQDYEIKSISLIFK